MILSNEYMTSERRRHRRSDVANAIEYVMNSLNAEEVFDGVVANISESGLCLLTTNYLSQGEHIRILKQNPPQSFRKATVRWSQQSHELYYKAGIEFI